MNCAAAGQGEVGFDGDQLQRRKLADRARSLMGLRLRL